MNVYVLLFFLLCSVLASTLIVKLVFCFNSFYINHLKGLFVSVLSHFHVLEDGLELVILASVNKQNKLP